jgi:hypothetical protein
MPSLGEVPSGGARALWLLSRFSKVTRRKGATKSRRYRHNGYVRIPRVGAGVGGGDLNHNPYCLKERDTHTSFASKLAPTQVRANHDIPSATCISNGELIAELAAWK